MRQSTYLTLCVLFRLCQPVLCLCGGRKSVDGIEGCRSVIWEVRNTLISFTNKSEV